jgi:rusticyanin
MMGTDSSGYGGPGGYGQGMVGPGWGGYGDSGGYQSSGGMMGGYGMMGAYPWQGEQQPTFSEAMRLLDRNAAEVRIDKAKNEVVFRGNRISLAMAAVQPGSPDTTFEVEGLVDPTIVVPTGSLVTLTLLNMDYGANMDHGVVITPIRPPYPVLSMMGLPDSFTGVPVLAPRDSDNAKQARYPEASVTFRAGSPGTYYYLCQYYDHASKGMYGRFIVSAK